MKLKHLIALLLAAALLLGVGAPAFAADTLRLIVPADWELEVGDSRTVDYVFSSGVTDRMLTWTAQSQGGAATVDKWGRVTAVSPGEVAITASQTGGAGLTDTVTLKVTASSAKGAAHAAAVNYQGTAVAELENLQKLVTRWTTLEAQAAAEVPDEIKAILGGTDTDPHIAAETADGAEWTIEAYGVLRTGGIAATARDEEMRFMGDRYFHYPA
ncbi:MAG: hypothetical protein LBL15_04200, partial [Oscillospiraceae bacterium]|nr:hypothetical protein [Oscillospiraceae bacterium]